MSRNLEKELLGFQSFVCRVIEDFNEKKNLFL